MAYSLTVDKSNCVESSDLVDDAEHGDIVEVISGKDKGKHFMCIDCTFFMLEKPSVQYQDYDFNNVYGSRIAAVSKGTIFELEVK